MNIVHCCLSLFSSLYQTTLGKSSENNTREQKNNRFEVQINVAMFRKSDRQTDRQTYRQTHSQTEEDIDRHVVRQRRHRHTHSQTEEDIIIHIVRQRKTQTVRQRKSYRQTHRLTERQRDLNTDR